MPHDSNTSFNNGSSSFNPCRTATCRNTCTHAATISVPVDAMLQTATQGAGEVRSWVSLHRSADDMMAGLNQRSCGSHAGSEMLQEHLMCI